MAGDKCEPTPDFDDMVAARGGRGARGDDAYRDEGSMRGDFGENPVVRRPMGIAILIHPGGGGERGAERGGRTSTRRRNGGNNGGSMIQTARAQKLPKDD
jgi:hypothetical protein